MDGEAAVSTSISAAMRSRGWVVEITDHGPTAVELALTGRFRLIILDLDSPGEGLTILQEILGARPEQKVLAICGNEQAETGIQALAVGATDYVVRPFSVGLSHGSRNRRQAMPAGNFTAPV